MADDQTLTFVPEIVFIRDIDGGQVAVPRVTASREIRVSRAITRWVKAQEAGLLDSLNLSVAADQGAGRLALAVMEYAPDLVVEVAAAIFEKTPEEIGDRFELHELMDALTPFLPGQIKMVTKMLGAILSQRTLPAS